MRDGAGTQALCMQYPLGSSLGEGADILHMRKARQGCTRSHKQAAGVLQPRTPSLQSLCSLQTEEEEDPRQAGEMWTGGGGLYSHSTRSMTGAEVVAPLGSSAQQWYAPAWVRATWAKARVGTGSTCSRWPFQNQAKVELPMGLGPPER